MVCIFPAGETDYATVSVIDLPISKNCALQRNVILFQDYSFARPFISLQDHFIPGNSLIVRSYSCRTILCSAILLHDRYLAGPFSCRTILQDHSVVEPFCCRTTLLQDHSPAGPFFCKTILLPDHSPVGPFFYRTVLLQDYFLAGQFSCKVTFSFVDTMQACTLLYS